jgi:hypothetical protein
VVSVAVSDGGVAGAQGRFCSVDHGARWLTSGPVLYPLRQPGQPAQPVAPGQPGDPAAVLRGGTALLRALLLVIILIVGIVGIAVFLIVHAVT